jgi:hypothetical protein
MQATVKYPRLSAVIAAIEETGRTRAEIGRLAGRDGSAATRWAKGTHLPGWSAVRSLSDALRADSPGLADNLLETWHYYSDPVERGPDSTIPPEVMAALERAYKGERELLKEAVEALEAIERERRETDGSPSQRHAG